MSIAQDAEVAANVQVGGIDRSALYYDSVAHIWYTKNQAGVSAPLINGVSSVNNLTGAVDLSGTYQPLDSDLTSIAAVATQAYGRSLLALANQTALANELSTFYQPLDSDLTAIAGVATQTYGRSLLALANQTALANELSTFYQPLDADLTAIAALVTTPYGRSQLALANATADTAQLDAATTALKGLQSASDKSKSDNWFDKAFYNVLDHGISPANSASANVTAWNALLAASVDNATIFFPPSTSTYDFASVLTIPSGRHVRIVGGGNEKTLIRTTSGTDNIFSVGDWYTEFVGLKFLSSVTRTAGAAILSGNNVAINVFDCDFAGMFNGIVYQGGVNSGNLALVRNCHFTDTVNFSIQIDGTNCNMIMTQCTADCTSPAVAHLEINACGSLLISNCDFIRATNNMRLNPDSGIKGVFSVYCVNTFFDTAAGSSVKYMGAGTTNIQRSKFVNCWFSGSTNGIEFASTATNLPTAIDFIGCDIYSNSANGILATAVQDFAMTNCRVAGNATAGINILAATGAVTKFNIQNCTVGPTAGVGANGIGINIQAGNYGSYTVSGNNVAGNTSGNNIIDSGSVPTTDLKQITDNLGHLLEGAIATQGGTALSVPITTETVVLSARIPANSVSIGQVFVIRGIGVMSAANVPTWRVRVGATGGVGDTACLTITTAAGVANGRHGCDLLLTVRSIGAGGTVNCEGLAHSGTAATTVTWSQPALGAATTTAAATNAAWFITLTLSQTIGSSLIQQAVIQSL